MMEGFSEPGTCQTMPLAEAYVVFFPTKDDYQSMRQAKDICRACPVLLECRRYALQLPSHQLGIIAAMGQRERSKAQDRLTNKGYWNHLRPSDDWAS